MNTFATIKIAAFFSSRAHLCERLKSNRTGSKADTGRRMSGTTKKNYEIANSSRDNLNMHCFASGTNAKYMEYLFSKWTKDELSVHVSWQKYFEEILLDSNKEQNRPKPNPGAVSDLIEFEEDREQKLGAGTETSEAMVEDSVKNKTNL